MEIRNAIIEDARIVIEECGLLSAYLYLDYGDSGQSFGGYALYLPDGFKYHSIMKSSAGHFIFRCLEIAGVDEWSKLKGKAIRVKQDHCKVYAIGHIVKDDWFCPSEDFKDEKYGEE